MLITQKELEELLLKEFGVTQNEICHFTPLDISVFVKQWSDEDNTNYCPSLLPD